MTRGEISVIEILETMPPEADSIRVRDLLTAQSQWGKHRTREFLREYELLDLARKRLDGLIVREAQALTKALTPPIRWGLHARTAGKLQRYLLARPELRHLLDDWGRWDAERGREVWEWLTEALAENGELAPSEDDRKYDRERRIQAERLLERMTCWPLRSRFYNLPRSHPNPNDGGITMKEATRASVTTTFKLKALEFPVALFKVTGKGEKTPEWETAGPNGGKLAREVEAGASKADAFMANSGAKTKATAPAARPFVEEGSGEKVPAEEVRRGVRKADGTFVDLGEQIEQVEDKVSGDSFRVVGFIDRRQFPRERVVGGYWVGIESGTGTEAAYPLRLIFETLKMTGKIAVVIWTKRKGQTLGLLSATGHGALLVNEIAWADECRVPGPRSLVIQHTEMPTEGEKDAAATLVERMAASKSSLDERANPLTSALARLKVQAEEGELDGSTFEDVEEPEEMGDLVELLRASAAS